MNLYIKDEYGRRVQVWTALKMMGVETGRAPTWGMTPRAVQGIIIWVEPLKERITLPRRKPHRVRAICPACHKEMSFGRLAQHSKVHTRCERCGSQKPSGQSCGCFDNGSQ